MRDPYAGHRDNSDGYWRPDPLRDTQWTPWDFALLEAVEAISMLTSGDSGELRMLAEDPDVSWEIDYRVDYAAADYEKYMKDREVEPGVSFFLTNPTKPDDKPFWTIAEWLANIESGAQKMDRDAPEGARPPTAEEMAEMQERRRRAIEGADD